MKTPLILRIPRKRKLHRIADCLGDHVLCRSLLILLGVLYRYQKRTRSRALDLASSDLDMDSDVSTVLGATCAKYWGTCHLTGVTIRRGVPSSTVDTLQQVCEENREELARQLNINTEDVIMTWVSELQTLEVRQRLTRLYFRHNKS